MQNWKHTHYLGEFYTGADGQSDVSREQALCPCPHRLWCLSFRRSPCLRIWCVGFLGTREHSEASKCVFPALYSVYIKDPHETLYYTLLSFIMIHIYSLFTSISSLPYLSDFKVSSGSFIIIPTWMFSSMDNVVSISTHIHTIKQVLGGKNSWGISDYSHGSHLDLSMDMENTGKESCLEGKISEFSLGHCLIQWSSTESDFCSLRRHLTMSRNIFSCNKWEVCYRHLVCRGQVYS